MKVVLGLAIYIEWYQKRVDVNDMQSKQANTKSFLMLTIMVF